MKMYGITEETLQGEQSLLIWEGPFASVYTGYAKHTGTGYRIFLYDDTVLNIPDVPVRDDKNWSEVDTAISEAVRTHFETVEDNL